MTTVQDDSTGLTARIEKLLEKVAPERHELALTAVGLLGLALQPCTERDYHVTSKQWHTELQENLEQACLTAYFVGLRDGENKAKAELEAVQNELQQLKQST